MLRVFSFRCVTVWAGAFWLFAGSGRSCVSEALWMQVTSRGKGDPHVIYLLLSVRLGQSSLGLIIFNIESQGRAEAEIKRSRCLFFSLRAPLAFSDHLLELLSFQPPGFDKHRTRSPNL